jgi:hypothetical protein
MHADFSRVYENLHIMVIIITIDLRSILLSDSNKKILK